MTLPLTDYERALRRMRAAVGEWMASEPTDHNDDLLLRAAQAIVIVRHWEAEEHECECPVCLGDPPSTWP